MAKQGSAPYQLVTHRDGDEWDFTPAPSASWWVLPCNPRAVTASPCRKLSLTAPRASCDAFPPPFFWGRGYFSFHFGMTLRSGVYPLCRGAYSHVASEGSGLRGTVQSKNNVPGVAEQAGSCSGSGATGLACSQNLSRLLSSRCRDIRHQNPIGHLSHRTSATAPEP